MGLAEEVSIEEVIALTGAEPAAVQSRAGCRRWSRSDRRQHPGVQLIPIFARFKRPVCEQWPTRVPASFPGTGVFDVAECPLPDARHRHRPREDPGLGASRGRSRLSLHRGRRSRLRRGAARRLEAGLQRADPFHETFTTMAFIAAVTKKIKLCSGVLILPQRQTGVVAKQAAEVDILSGGRLRLGSASAGTMSSTRRWAWSGRRAARGRPSRSR